MANADQIRAAAATMPVQDADAAQRLKAAQAAVFGQLAQQAGPTAGIRDAQAAAPQLTQTEGATALQAAQQGGQNLLQAGGQANAAEQQADQASLEARATGQQLAQTKAAAAQQVAESAAEAAQRVQMSGAEQAQAARLQAMGLTYDNQLAFMSRKQRDDLANLGRDVKQKLFDDRLTFAQDEAGRKFTNDRQLADYDVANAKSKDELQDKLQQVNEAQQRKAYMVDAAFAKVGQQLDQQYQTAVTNQDNATKARLAELKRLWEIEKQKRERQAGAMSAAVSGAMSGAAAGTAVEPGYGTIIGGVIGAGAGYYTATQGQ